MALKASIPVWEFNLSQPVWQTKNFYDLALQNLMFRIDKFTSWARFCFQKTFSNFFGITQAELRRGAVRQGHAVGGPRGQEDRHRGEGPPNDPFAPGQNTVKFLGTIASGTTS